MGHKKMSITDELQMETGMKDILGKFLKRDALEICNYTVFTI